MSAPASAAAASKPRVAVFAGSIRAASWNVRLAVLAAAAAEEAGADVRRLDLREYAMPLFDEDAEAAEGMPGNARRFRAELIAADGFIVACPEYNSSITPLLKNAIDWASRPQPGDPQLVAFRGKVAGLLAASPGALGGLRGLVTVRSILGNIGVLVLPDQHAVSKAHEAFAADGSLKDAAAQQAVGRVAREVVRVSAALRAAAAARG